MRYLFIAILILFLTLPAISADKSQPRTYRPKVFGYVEVGERYVEDQEDDDYGTDEFSSESYYKFNLKKIGFKQNLSKKSLFSLTFKTNEKDYQNISDTGLSNITKTLSGYIRFKLIDPLTFKLEANYRQSSYDLTSSDFKESDWTAAAISLIYKNKQDPAKNYFFNSPKNRYLLKIGYKRQLYPVKSTNNANTTSLLIHWDYKHNKKLTIKTKGRIFKRDFEYSSLTHKDSTRESIQVGGEYQF